MSDAPLGIWRRFLAGRTSTALAFAALWALNFTMLAGLGALKPHLVVQVQTENAGVFRCYPITRNGSYGADEVSLECSPGLSRQSYQLRDWGGLIRWDPPDGPGTWTLRDAAIYVAGIRREIPLADMGAGRDIAAIERAGAGITIRARTDAVDPQVMLRAHPKALLATWLLVLLTVSAAISGLLFALARTLTRRHGPRVLWCCLPSIAVIVTGYFLCGTTPVDDGCSWDGGAYLRHIQDLVAGNPTTLKFYQSIRLGSFPHFFALSACTLDRPETVEAARYCDALIMGSSACLLCLAALRIGLAPLRVACTGIALSLSWPVFCAPFLCPVLSDHVAILLACLAIWGWAHGRNVLLVGLLIWSFTVIPLLFIVPLALLALPRREHPEAGALGAAPQQAGSPPKMAIAALCGLGAMAACHALLERVPDQALLDRAASQLATANLPLRPFSIAAADAMVFASVAGAALGAVNLLTMRHLVGWRWLAAGLGSCAACGLAFAIVAPRFTNKGFPAFAANLLVQAQAAPLKQLAAHAYHSGFIFIAAFVLALRSTSARAPDGLTCLLVLFAPLLALGSETRQFPYLLPIAAIFANRAVRDTRCLLALLAGGAVLLLPALSAQPHMKVAFDKELDFLSPEWQYYFGRQGPWMSTEAYVSVLGAAVAMVLALLIIKLSSDRGRVGAPPQERPTP